MMRRVPRWMPRVCPAVVWLLAGASADSLRAAEPVKGNAGGHAFVFRDAGDDAGAMPHLAGIRGHGAAWGDIDGSGFPSLFVATFHDNGSQPSMLLRNAKGHFLPDAQEHLRTSGSGSGALFVDLTNSGRLDLYVSNCANRPSGVRAAASVLFRNDGAGRFTNVSEQSGACPAEYSGRGLSALDHDGDGLLDLLTCERYYGSVRTGPVLHHNKGDFHFENVSEIAGLPVRLAGLGVAVADVNDDGWPDIFLTSGAGDHRLLLNDGAGKFREAPGSREIFRWDCPSDSDTPAGVCIADVSRDGLPDVVIGHHYKQPWVKPVSIRLYLHRGVKNGVPAFEDVTVAAGIVPMAMKAPHVEIQDLDNDGWPDIATSIVKFKDGVPYPVIYRNTGMKDGVPRFREDAWGVNDFPNKDDLARKRSGAIFDKALAENSVTYTAAGPSGDYDRDGRLDLFLPTWWVAGRTLLLRNETPGGNWLEVEVEGRGAVNRMGIGAKVKVYPAGKLAQPAALIGCREISAGYGFCSGQEAAAHFGLGETAKVDLEISLPHGKGEFVRKGIEANQRVTVRQP